MKLFFSILIAFLSFFFSANVFAKVSEKPIVIIIPSYQNTAWCANNLHSVYIQKYKNYRVIYIDDASTDGTGVSVEKILKDKKMNYSIFYFDDSFSNDITTVTNKFKEIISKKTEKFILVKNLNRAGALTNLYRSISSCNDNEIIVTLDGDDWFYGDKVLERINKAYSSNKVWLTHGTLMHYPNGHADWCEPIPQDIVTRNAFREYKCPSHLRTFYAWLFKKINLNDLLYNGHFFPMAWDMAIMFPMIEMAGERHEFIYDINYVYNVANQINDNKVNAQLQRDLDALIRSMPRYNRL